MSDTPATAEEVERPELPRGNLLKTSTQFPKRLAFFSSLLKLLPHLECIEFAPILMGAERITRIEFTFKDRSVRNVREWPAEWADLKKAVDTVLAIPEYRDGALWIRGGAEYMGVPPLALPIRGRV
jgi:hypothetical protein